MKHQPFTSPSEERLRTAFFSEDVALNDGDRVPLVSVDGDAESPGLGFESICRLHDGRLRCEKQGREPLFIDGYPYTYIKLGHLPEKGRQ